MNNNATNNTTDAQLRKISRKEMKVDFEGKLSFKERFRLKYLSFRFLGVMIYKLFRLILLVGISYIIIYPFITKILSSFMSTNDLVDVTVKLIPRNPTLDQWKYIIIENKYFLALFNTARISLLCGFFQTLICAIIGYGFAKFKFKGRNILFFCVIITMLIPHDTLLLAMFMHFRYFDIYGLYGLITGAQGINLINTEWPLYLLSLTGLAFKNGLYIFIFRQFYKGVPDELEEAAYIDGTGVFQTFFRIILPLSVPMMTTVFMFSFSWQWTDTFYTASPFFTTNDIHLLPNIVEVPQSLKMEFAASGLWESIIMNTCGLLVIIPLFIIFLFAQRSFVEGIERSGIVG
ncbi:MAG: carbohydrate ABC transporter permease [Ruminococcaceae bacterium]|nr:carbohydrate ABC transporter permease [Oscillospiraceae bacterium]